MTSNHLDTGIRRIAAAAKRSESGAFALRISRFAAAALVAGAAVSLAGCSSGGKSRPKNAMAPAQINTIGVNSYLWRAALDTLSFMPLTNTDSSGGVIVTDWYSNPSNPNERMKLSVTILDSDLRADALRVAAIREVNQGGNWVNAPVSAATTQKLEDVILTRARDLRRGSVSG